MTPTATPGLSPSSHCPRTPSSLPHSLNLQGFWQLFVDPQVRECPCVCIHVPTCARVYASTSKWWDTDGPH